MTFEEILDQAIAMLQRRGRVAYRTLQVQFNLDCNALEALGQLQDNLRPKTMVLGRFMRAYQGM